MLGLLLLIIVIALALYALKEVYKIQYGITHQSPPPGAAEALANFIEDLGYEQGRLLELGSGYGGIVLSLARRLPDWDIVGVERSPTPWILSILRTLGKRYTNFRFYLSDPVLWPLKGYDVVLIHHDTQTLRRWEQSLARRMQPGILLITLNQRLPRIAPMRSLEIDSHIKFYFYQKQAQQPAQQTPEAAPASAPVAPADQGSLPLEQEQPVVTNT